MRQTLRPALVLLVLLLLPATTQAGVNDFVLNRFYKEITRGAWPAPATCDSPPCASECPEGVDPDIPGSGCVLQVTADNELFEQFATGFGLVLGPKFLAPAETLGQAGFDVGFEASFSAIDPSADHWKTAAPDPTETPGDLLSTMQIHVRKGLPFSFELGGTLTKLFDSDMFALGGELKWALNEGFYYLPDIAVRGSINRLLGSRDLDLTTGGVDVSISHPFGIGGMLQFTPYAGWSLLYINAGSHVLDATPGLPGYPPPYCEADGSDRRQPIEGEEGEYRTSAECLKAARAAATGDYRSNFVLSRQRIFVHRGFAGMQLRVTVVSFVLEAVVTESVNTYSARLGMNF